jgi:hypothetical protein
MAKKKIRKKSSPKKAPKPPVRRKISDVEYLDILIAASRRAITGQGSGVDEFFEQQASRLEKQKEELLAKK